MVNENATRKKVNEKIKIEVLDQLKLSITIYILPDWKRIHFIPFSQPPQLY